MTLKIWWLIVVGGPEFTRIVPDRPTSQRQCRQSAQDGIPSFYAVSSLTIAPMYCATVKIVWAMKPNHVPYWGNGLVFPILPHGIPD